MGSGASSEPQVDIPDEPLDAKSLLSLFGDRFDDDDFAKLQNRETGLVSPDQLRGYMAFLPVVREKHRTEIEAAATGTTSKFVTLIEKCGDQEIKKHEKEELTNWLKNEFKQIQGGLERIPVMDATITASKKLEDACHERHVNYLRALENYTPEINTFLGDAGGSTEITVHVPQWNFFNELEKEKEVVTMTFPNVCQLHAVPSDLTKFMFEAPKRETDPTREMKANIRTAFLRAGMNEDFEETYGGRTGTAVCGGEKQIPWANAVYMEGPVDCLCAFAANNINKHFVKFMTVTFGDRFTAAPVKTAGRIMAKSMEDLSKEDHKLWESLAGSMDQDKWNETALEQKTWKRIQLATMCLNVNDIVRGSVRCDGAEAMIAACNLLTTNLTGEPLVVDDHDAGQLVLKALRVKNTHHAEADTSGGYRDKKVISEFSIGMTGDRMLVEIQLIDTGFLEIKKYMHRIYGLQRGDSGRLPTEEGVPCCGRNKEMFERDDVLSAWLVDGTSVVGAEAFRDCFHLVEVRFPDGIVKISKNAFRGCASLRSLVLPAGLETIEIYAFKGCRKLASVTLPIGLKVIGPDAFAECESLGLIVFPDSLEDIQARAFKGCTKLESITLPVGPVTIGEEAFDECESFRSIVLPDGYRLTDIKGGNNHSAFPFCRNLEVITIPSGLSLIGQCAFLSCEHLRSIVLPEGLQEIGQRAFEGCTALVDLTLPAGLRVIKKHAFFKCKSLLSVALPEGLKEIQRFAFREAWSLESVTFPASLESVDVEAFLGCKTSAIPVEIKEKFSLELC